MKVSLLIFSFLFLSLVGYTQNELYAIYKSDETKRIHLSKGNYYRVKTLEGKALRGMLTKVTEDAIVLFKSHGASAVTIDNIASITLLYGAKEGVMNSSGFPAIEPRNRTFLSLKAWSLLIKKD